MPGYSFLLRPQGFRVTRSLLIPGVQKHTDLLWGGPLWSLPEPTSSRTLCGWAEKLSCGYESSTECGALELLCHQVGDSGTQCLEKGCGCGQGEGLGEKY